MSFRDGPFQDLKVPLAWTAAGVLLLALVAAVVLLMSDGGRDASDRAYGSARELFDKVDRPVSAVLSKPGEWIADAVAYVRGYFFAVSDNRKLKAQIVEMRKSTDAAAALASENGRLKAMLGLRTDPPIPMVAGRTVLDARGPYSQTRLINVGREKGVEVGNPVMNERGLVGRVVGVTDGASRILLLSDVASRTPVLIARSDARAILTGDGGPNPRLAYMRGADPVKAGDRVLTSGDGGVYPRGLPVGAAAKGLDGQWRVRLAADLASVDYVQVMKFKDFDQLVNLAELERAKMPPPTAGVTTPAETVQTNARPQAVGPGARPAARPAPAAARRATAAPARPRPPQAAPPRRRAPIPYERYRPAQQQPRPQPQPQPSPPPEQAPPY